jgi:hypothetical protein
VPGIAAGKRLVEVAVGEELAIVVALGQGEGERELLRFLIRQYTH